MIFIRHRLTSFLIAFFLSFCLHSSASAADIATVQKLQMPAWVKRGNTLKALRPRLELQPGDTIITGKRSRVVLSMAEGSDVKLGEKAEFKIKKAQNSNIFKGFFSVVSGAFRYTTNALSKNRPRDINFAVGGVTIGIRGTDIWGKSLDDKDLFCLLEGKVDVSTENDAPRPMTEALTHYKVEKGGSLGDLLPVDPEKLKGWAQQTEPQQGQGVIDESGKYRLHIMALSNSSYVADQIKAFSQLGYAINTEEYRNASGNWTRLYIGGLNTYEDAVSLQSRMNEDITLSESWIKRI